MTRLPRQKKALFFALSAVLLWSTVASAFKLSLAYVTPLELLLIASFISSLSLLIIVIITGKWHMCRTLSSRDLLISAGMGLLNPFLYYLILLKAYQLLPAQLAQPLNMTWGILIILLSVPLLGQKLTWRSLTAVFIAFLGVVVLATEGRIGELHFNNPLGVGLALSSSVLWALYWIFNTRDRQDPLIRLLFNFLFGFLFTFVLWISLGGLRILPWKGILGSCYTGLFEMGITFYLWLMAMKTADSAASVSILIYLAPFLSLVFIHLLVGETILLSSVAGLVLIVGGILFQQTDKSNRQK